MGSVALKPELTPETKRKILYASLLRFAPETVPLRERALDRLILGALLGSDEQNPFRVGLIQKNLLFGPTAPLLRPELIQESLLRLKLNGKVHQTELNKRHAYYLTNEASQELQKPIDSAQSLFARGLGRLLENTGHLLSFEAGQEVCRRFLCECFASCGTEIAKAVTGQLDSESLVNSAKLRAAFDAAACRYNLSSAARESLGVRCMEFLKSAEPDAVKLKFHLTQGFYFAQLVGLQENQFNPIAETAFFGSVFYLDTNVLFVGLFPLEGTTDLFDEMIGVTKRMGIELRVTRATINETRRVIADRIAALGRLLDSFPEEIVRKTSDQLVLAFLNARNNSAGLTPVAFFAPVEHLSDVIRDRWGIVVTEDTEDDTIGNRDLSEVAQRIHESALATRPYGKKGEVLRHDLCHYSLVQDQRARINAKTWFLTRDRGLVHAARLLRQNNDPPFCFSLIGFLQSLSPFLITDHEESSVADVFSGLLTEQILPADQLFSVKELVMLGEMHEDVLSTPQEQLVLALDYVKTTVLMGTPYQIEKANQVALGLRTFLACSAEERRKELEAQTVRLAIQAEQERAAAAVERREAQARTEEQLSLIEELGDKNETLSRQLLQVQSDLAALRQVVESRDENRRLLYMLAGFAGALLIWTLQDRLMNFLRREWIGMSLRTVQTILQLSGILLFCAPAVKFLHFKQWPENGRIACMGLLVFTAMNASGLLRNSTSLSAWVNIAILVATALMVVLAPKGLWPKKEGKS